MTVKPKRAAIPDDLRDIFKRVRILEAVPRALSSANAFDTYRDCIIADPTTLNLWPCDDASGNLVDIVGSDDMTVTASGGYPHYGDPGPFAGLPLQTAVSNNTVAGQARFQCPAGLPASAVPFTLQGWLYQNHASNGGYVWSDWGGGGGGVAKLLIIDSTTLLITYGHGNGLSVSGGALVFQTWTHIRVDYDGTTLRLLKDGVVLDTDTGTGSGAQGANFFLNNDNVGATGFAPFHGRAALWSLHSGIADTCGASGSGGSGAAPEFYVPAADGAGGTVWSPQTIEVDY